MKIKNKMAWQKFVKKYDGEKGMLVRYARELADRLEKKISSGAELSKSDIQTEPLLLLAKMRREESALITGAGVHVALAILVKVWDVKDNSILNILKKELARW